MSVARPMWAMPRCPTVVSVRNPSRLVPPRLDIAIAAVLVALSVAEGLGPVRESARLHGHSEHRSGVEPVTATTSGSEDGWQ
jgi:hypothetical protein